MLGMGYVEVPQQKRNFLFLILNFEFFCIFVRLNLKNPWLWSKYFPLFSRTSG